MIENLKTIRNVFLRLFVVSLIWYLLVTILYIGPLQDFMIYLMVRWYGLSPQNAYFLISLYLSLTELFVICFGFLPTLALHFAIKKRAKTQKSK